MEDEIKKFWKGDIESSAETLLKYSKDASIFEVRPELVLFPKNSTDIQNLVKWVNDNKGKYKNLSITMRAAGTCMSGGPLNDSLILDTTRYMNSIGVVKHVSPYKILPKFPNAKEVIISGEVTLEPGVYYRDLEAKTLEQGLILPCYTASKSINAIGGMIGNNSAGELTLRYGKTEDYVKELQVIFADGNEYTVKPLTRRELYTKISEATFEGQVYKQIFDILKDNPTLIKSAKPDVSKNSAGYNIWNIQSNVGADDEIFDLCQLFIGSQGTLGLITKITLRLVEKPALSKLVVVFLKDLNNLGNLVDKILETNPLTLESYDDKTFALAMKFFKDFVKAKGFFGVIKFGLSFIPEFFMVLTGGIPKLILLIEYEGNSKEEINQKCKNLVEKITTFKLRTHITKSEKEAKKYWDMRRDSFALLRKHIKGMHTAPFIDDVIVKPEHLPKFLPEIEAVLKEYKNMIFTIAGHAGNGNLHIIPLMDFKDSKTLPTILEVSDRIYDIVLRYQGSIDAEHNDGIIRTPYLRKMFGDQIYKLFEDIKIICDPKNILNPNKKVGEDKSFLENHIIRESNIAEHKS